MTEKTSEWFGRFQFQSLETKYQQISPLALPAFPEGHNDIVGVDEQGSGRSNPGSWETASTAETGTGIKSGAVLKPPLRPSGMT